MEKLVKKYLSRFAGKVLNLSSFTYLNLTQFLGALNDNLFKLIVVFHLIDIFDQDNTDVIQAVASAVFVLPFLLLSAATGKLADRHSKSQIIQLSKVLELVVMGSGVVMFWFFSEAKYAPFILLFMMAAQSAVFGPSKYGIVPEIVEEEKLSGANGLLSCFTFLAIIIGTSLAAYLTDITERNFILTGQVCVIIAFLGMMTSLYIEATQPVGSKKKIYPMFWMEIYASLKRSAKIPLLFMVILCSSYFWFIGSYLQLNIIPYGISSLGLTDVQGGYLFVLIALGIGSGSAICGRLSGKNILLGIVPLAGVSIMVLCLLIHLFSFNLPLICFLLVIIGFAGGCFAVPLDSYIQAKSPSRIRGQMIACANFLSFVGVLASAISLIVITRVLGLSSSEGFVIMGLITLAVSIAFANRIKGHMVFILGELHLLLKKKKRISNREFFKEEFLVVTSLPVSDIMDLSAALEIPLKVYTKHVPSFLQKCFFADHLDVEKIIKDLSEKQSVCLCFKEGEDIQEDLALLEENLEIPVIYANKNEDEFIIEEK
jgi:acyl-[acyl-carrier-protein]-phospholipid O-acyltransferase / long-chain-fatty-acid--[acyl-carrier-protein] ligase